MPNAFPIELRDRAVAAYVAGGPSYAAVANQFSVSARTLLRWVTRMRETGSAAALRRGGGWHSPVDLAVMHAVVREKPDGTTEELTRLYNGRVGRPGRVHRSSFLRALRRSGYVFKKNARGPRKSTAPTCERNVGRSSRGRPR